MEIFSEGKGVVLRKYSTFIYQNACTYSESLYKIKAFIIYARTINRHEFILQQHIFSNLLKKYKNNIYEPIPFITILSTLFASDSQWLRNHSQLLRWQHFIPVMGTCPHVLEPQSSGGCGLRGRLVDHKLALAARRGSSDLALGLTPVVKCQRNGLGLGDGTEWKGWMDGW